MVQGRKFKVRKGDTVEVIAGRDSGRRGTVEAVVPANGRVLIEGINIRKRHARPRAVGQPAGIIEFNAPIDVSNVMLICTHCGERTRVGNRIDADGVKRRYCRKCAEMIDE